MGESKTDSIATQLVLIGESSRQESFYGIESIACTPCPADPLTFLQELRAIREHTPIIVLLDLANLPEKLITELVIARKTTAILGLLDGSVDAKLTELCDTLIKVDQLLAIKPILAALRLLSETRKRLDLEEKALSQKVRMLDQVSMAIIGTDLNGAIKAWNQRAESMFGFSNQEAIGQPLTLIFQNAASSDFHLHKLLEPLLIHDRHQFETDIRRRDGVLLPIHLSLSLEKNTQGDIIGVICCCRDISLRRRVESEKRHAYQRLTFFIERMPLGFIEWGVDGNIRAWNQSAEDIFGYSQKEAIGQPFSMLVKDEFVEECRQIFKLMTDGKGGNHSHNENITRDGQTIMCDWNNTALLDEKENVVGFASIVADITEQLRIEKELKQSRESAHAANRSKDEFLAVMSHEVRTPMNSIIGFADLLMESLKDEEQAELVNIIKANAFNLLELISNVLNYSRLEAGRVALKEQETDLMALFQEVREVTQAEATEKNLTFDVEILPGTPRYVYSDYTELRQVLLNLTANALKFTKVGGVKITVGAKPFASSDSKHRWELLFAVKDTGIGIEDCDHDKLFQSFTQLDSSSTRRFGGTGLGLAICRRIVELWHGRIWAESNIKEGSTFYFTLPTQENAQEAREYQTSPLYEEIDDRRFAEIFPMKIVLLCPNHSSGEVLVHIMSNLGYDLTTQYDAVEAISHLQENAYDIILIDDDIKEFTVAEMTQIIREGQAGVANKSANMVFFSEHGPQNKESTAPFARGVESISKPIIARNVRMIFRKLAIERDTARTQSKS